LRSQKSGVIAIDGGALLFKEDKLPGARLDQEKATARGIVAAYNRMNFTALGIAPQDLAGGLDFLLALQKEANFPWLSANLVNRESGRPYFTPRTMVMAGGLKIGLIGLTGGPEPTGSKAALLPWEKVLPGEIAGFGKEVGMLILLSSLDPASNKKIAAKHPEINLIIQAGTQAGNQPPEQVGNSLLTRVEPRGKYLGIMEIGWDPRTRKWQDRREEKLILDKKSQLDSLAWQIGRYRRMGEPETAFAKQPETLAAYQDLVARHKGLEEEIAVLSAAVKTQGAAGLFDYRFAALGKEVPDDPAVKAIVEETTSEIARLGQMASKAESGKGQGLNPEGYAGNGACQGCHPAESANWRASRHAAAYRTLENKNQQFNGRCLPCHVTGAWGLTDEKVLGLNEEMRGVGCESCHGPAGAHAAGPQGNKPAKAGQNTCLRCHNQEHHDGFNFAKAITSLGCGK